MSVFRELGESVAHRLLDEPLRAYFSDKMELLGIGAAIAPVAGLALAMLAVKFALAAIEPSPAPDWKMLDPDDNRALAAAYNNLSWIAQLERLLSEPVSDTLDGFRDQVRKLDLFRKDALDQLDPDDEGLMADLFERKDVVARVAASAGVSTPATIDELRSILRTRRIPR